MYRKLFFIATVIAAMTSCSNGGNGAAEKDAVDTVKVETLKRGTFDEPFTAQGKVKASKYADLAFETSLPIKAVYVRNGQSVTSGQRIAELDMFKMSNAIEQAKKQVEQARLNMQDVIISQGYDPDKPQTVPENIKQLAQVKSGYSLALSQLDAAKHDIGSGTLTAPFAGVVANLSIQPHSISQAGTTVCRIIATDEMEVEFKVMEGDLCIVKVGSMVTITPIATKAAQYEARVMDINPMVDENGAVSVRAKLKADRNLFDGMNVEVSFTRHIENVTIVPRQVIVIRNGRHVIFTYDNGVARQHYVSIRHEAKGQCVVETADDLKGNSLLVVGGHETISEGENIARSK